MSREQWRAVWRWMRTEKKRLAWEFGPTYPEAPVLVAWRELVWLNVTGVGVRKLGSFPL